MDKSFPKPNPLKMVMCVSSFISSESFIFKSMKSSTLGRLIFELEGYQVISNLAHICWHLVDDAIIVTVEESDVLLHHAEVVMPLVIRGVCMYHSSSFSLVLSST